MKQFLLYCTLAALILAVPPISISANAGDQNAIAAESHAQSSDGQRQAIASNDSGQPDKEPVTAQTDASSVNKPAAPAKHGLWDDLLRIYGNSWINKKPKEARAVAANEPAPAGIADKPTDESGEQITAQDDIESVIDDESVDDENGQEATVDDSVIINDTGADDATEEDDAVTAETQDGLPDVPVVVNRNVEAYIKYFQGRGRKHFAKWLERSPNYMPIITGILVDEGVPEDLFYIAFIESGLSPNAKSRAKAVGMWQFIKGTAKKYGLRVDWWIDERRDPEKSTRAAARYFKNLYDRFGSWYLAAAGYNAGEGRIMKAMKRRKSNDFWDIAVAPKRGQRRLLKKETRDYVPKYLAAMMMAKDPEKYGFPAPAETTGLAVDRVKVSGVTDLKVIAEASGVTLDEIKKLNPELLHWFTPPNYPEYEVKLPAGTADRFAENIAKIPPPERVRFHEHKVRRGDSLSKIAKLYGTNIKPIMYLNNIKNQRRLKPGTMIVIPIREAAQKSGKKVADAINVQWEIHG